MSYGGYEKSEDVTVRCSDCTKFFMISSWLAINASSPHLCFNCKNKRIDDNNKQTVNQIKAMLEVVRNMDPKEFKELFDKYKPTKDVINVHKELERIMDKNRLL